jgi:3-oxoacyl-[acyl-carrier-protein] synthase II
VARVVVTGLGVVAPVGQSAHEAFTNVVAARSGIALVASATNPAPHSLVAGQVAFDPGRHWPPHASAHLDRATQFALVAAKEAVADAGLELGEEESFRAGVYWGTGLGGATTVEEGYRTLLTTAKGRLRPSTVVQGMSNAAAAQISIAHGLRGPALNVSTACSSSAMSVGEAYRAIQAGHADVIVAGGSEALITDGNLRAWDATQAMAHADPADPSRSCKPFAADRAGLVLGEGAAALVLERADRATRRGAHVYGEITGYGNASDAAGMSKPDAAGQVRAMRLALADGRHPPDAIGYVNAHGTATRVGDVVETGAIRQVYGAHARTLCVSSTKAVHGHLMGAAGALEMLIALMALERGIVPPTAHLDRPDTECDLDYVPNEARQVALRAVMSNSFGFGGMNAVLVAQRYSS